MNYFSLFEAREQYFEFVNFKFPNQAKQIISETNSIFYRVLQVWGFERSSAGKKITDKEIKAAEIFMRGVSVRRLPNAHTALAEAFERHNMSEASRRTYGARFNAFLAWSREQDWWFRKRQENIENECCPLRTRRPYSEEMKLTTRSKRYEKYRLMENERSPALQEEYLEFKKFLGAAYYPGRVCGVVSEVTEESYLGEISYMLGYLYRYEKMPLEKLRLSTLLPVITLDQLEPLSAKAQKQLWQEQRLYLEGWLFRHFEFIKEFNGANSPRSRTNRLTALQRLGHFLYRDQVFRYGDYRAIPLFLAMDDLLHQELKITQEWRVAQTSVSNFSKKWPDVAEGETALMVIRRDLLEPLRLETRPRLATGRFRPDIAIAKSLQDYLKWMFLTDIPAHRQQVYRSLRIALSCPIERPEIVPLEGCYFPVPPDEFRERDAKGKLTDNYLYKTYHFRGKNYPEGLWVLELRSYKTAKTYGVYSIPITNRPFEDSTCTYDYIERYLCGWWLCAGYRNRPIYDWWDIDYIGRHGCWITKGRISFNPDSQPTLSPDWFWGVVFPEPSTGEATDAKSFGSSFSSTSWRFLGKKMSPHMMRSVWATWAFQVNLTEQQRHSLAFAMGHSYETMHRVYTRITPAEQIHPIFEAIDIYLFGQIEALPENPVARSRAADIANQLFQLTPQERQEVLKLVEGK